MDVFRVSPPKVNFLRFLSLPSELSSFESSSIHSPRIATEIDMLYIDLLLVKTKRRKVLH